MNEGIIKTYQGIPVIGSWDLAIYLKMQHRRLLRHINNRFGEIPKVDRLTKKKGGQVKECLLTARQCRILITSMSNEVIDFYCDLDFFIYIQKGIENDDV